MLGGELMKTLDPQISGKRASLPSVRQLSGDVYINLPISITVPHSAIRRHGLVLVLS